MPPIFKRLLLATVMVPPAVVRSAVKAPKSNVPVVTKRLLATFILLAKLTVFAVLKIIRSLKVVANEPPIVCAVVPLKLTLLVPAVSAFTEALLVQFPPTSILLAPTFKIPAESVTFFFTVSCAGNKSPAVLLSVRLLNVVTPV